ncbi:MAG: DNA polymerase III subunit delta, partial [Pseudomonadota bacterium]
RSCRIAAQSACRVPEKQSRNTGCDRRKLDFAMGSVKAHEADRILSNAKEPLALVCLVYGPDRGIVSERAKRLIALSKVNVDDPFSYIRLLAGDISGSAASRLVDEVNTVSMFGDVRLIHLEDAGNDAGLVGAIKNVLESIESGTFLIIEAGDLKKGAALRTAIERFDHAIAVPCYADDEKSLQALVDQTMQTAGKQLTLEARQFLIANLGGDRGTTRQEIEKLLTYCAHEQRIELEHVTAIIGDMASVAVDSIVDGVLVGQLTQCETGLVRLEASGGSAFVLLSALMRQFQSLALMRDAMETDRKTVRAVVETARPPVFFKRKQTVTDALNLWSGAMIRDALARIRETIIDSRRSHRLETSHIRMMILSLGYKAQLRKRRG